MTTVSELVKRLRERRGPPMTEQEEMAAADLVEAGEKLRDDFVDCMCPSNEHTSACPAYHYDAVVKRLEGRDG